MDVINTIQLEIQENTSKNLFLKIFHHGEFHFWVCKKIRISPRNSFFYKFGKLSLIIELKDYNSKGNIKSRRNITKSVSLKL